jgi:hypothetical protein
MFREITGPDCPPAVRVATSKRTAPGGHRARAVASIGPPPARTRGAGPRRRDGDVTTALWRSVAPGWSAGASRRRARPAPQPSGGSWRGRTTGPRPETRMVPRDRGAERRAEVGHAAGQAGYDRTIVVDLQWEQRRRRVGPTLGTPRPPGCVSVCDRLVAGMPALVELAAHTVTSVAGGCTRAARGQWP